MLSKNFFEVTRVVAGIAAIAVGFVVLVLGCKIFLALLILGFPLEALFAAVSTCLFIPIAATAAWLATVAVATIGAVIAAPFIWLGKRFFGLVGAKPPHTRIYHYSADSSGFYGMSHQPPSQPFVTDTAPWMRDSAPRSQGGSTEPQVVPTELRARDDLTLLTEDQLRTVISDAYQGGMKDGQQSLQQPCSEPTQPKGLYPTESELRETFASTVSYCSANLTSDAPSAPPILHMAQPPHDGGSPHGGVQSSYDDAPHQAQPQPQQLPPGFQPGVILTPTLYQRPN